ncbi:TPA: hypothetical protein ACSS3U_000451, partial [Neisseria meningitidis]
KSGQGDEAADSTNSTEPIHLVLQHLRESFSLSQGEATTYWFLLIHYTAHCLAARPKSCTNNRSYIS